MAGDILQSLLWGFVASIPLIMGAILASFVTLPRKMIAAIFISNFLEGLASTQGMRSHGRSKKQILLIWGLVVVGTMASAIGFSVLSKAQPEIVSAALSFASGAILVMLAESMISEAFEEGGSVIGLATMAGFAIAFVLGKVRGG